MKTFLRLLRLATPYKWWMLLSAFIGFLTVGSGIGLLMTSAYIISKAALHPSISELQVGIVGVRFFGISRGVFRYLERLISHNTTFRLLSRFRVWFYHALEPLAPARLTHFKSTDLLNRIVSDIQTLEHFYVKVLAPPLIAIFISLLMWLLLHIFNPIFSLTLFFFYLVAGIGVPLLSYLYSRGLGKQLIGIRTKITQLTVDGIQGMSDLLLFNQATVHQLKLVALNRRYQQLQKQMAYISGLGESLIGLLMNGAVLVMLIIAIPQVSNSTLNGVYLAVISLGIMASFEAFLPLPEAWQFLEMNIRAADRLFEIIDAQPVVKDPPRPEKKPAQFDLKIHNLSFAYPNQERMILKNISMEISYGSRVAVVGPSGAGKSTLANLLLRFWEYEKGHIRIGGQELKALSQQEVRSIFGVVSQQTHLFSGTILDNLRLANPKASDEAVAAVLAQANLSTFIANLENGLQTWIGEQGLKLSGGERQRLAIARILLRATPILFLDEATSNLDSETEQQLLSLILSLPSDPTIFHITHRLIGLDQFDQVFVMQNGTICESGTHNELLARKGVYAGMWHIQMEQLALEKVI